MTKNLLLGSAIAMFLAAPVMAQTTPPKAGDTTPPASSSTMSKPGGADTMGKPSETMAAPSATTAAATGAFLDKQEAGQMRADEIIGASVKNPKDEDVGTIDDLIFDKDGKIVGAVVSVGGFLGMGAKSVGVDWNELQVRSSDAIVVQWTKEELQSAPDFQTQEDIKAERDSAARGAGTPPAGGMGAPSTAPTR
ncbi:sporulation protein YlmC with PRC-barrel domain [Constrictibacter sp. MBR-5]|jgi:sporulation protein YlmC with PRC-barrel domain|uniref:PRC-barrel domain-containing protein n=1 Tax=Constrictibacter sp. MBR-5 TaxID=3156467 RepID=UPI0033911946